MGRALYRRRGDGVCEIVRTQRAGRAASAALRTGATLGAALALVGGGALLVTLLFAIAVPLAAGTVVALAAVFGPPALARVRRSVFTERTSSAPAARGREGAPQRRAPLHARAAPLTSIARQGEGRSPSLDQFPGE